MTWTWDYITIVYVAILLIFIIIGYFKGFSKGIIGLIGTAVSLIAAFLLAKPLGNLTYGKWGGGLTTSIDTAIVSKVPALGQPISDNVDSVLSSALTSIGIPSSIQGMITPSIEKLIPSGATDIVLSTYIAQTLSNLVFIIGSFLVLFIVFMIVFAILKGVIGKLAKSIKLVKWLDKLLGVVSYACIALLLIAVASYCFTFVVTLSNGASDWVISQMHLDDDTVMTPAKWVYEYNLIQRLFNLYL